MSVWPPPPRVYGLQAAAAAASGPGGRSDVTTMAGIKGGPGALSAGDLGLILGLGRSPGGVATHSSILAWRIPRTEDPGGLQFIGPLRRTQQSPERPCQLHSIPHLSEAPWEVP